MRKMKLSLVMFLVLVVMFFITIISTGATDLNAAAGGRCEAGGCSCGTCSDCNSFAFRTIIAGVSMVLYGCECNGIYCQGAAV